MLLRGLLWLLTHTVYRLRVVGRANVPTGSGALLVANHASFADAIFVAAASPRPVRFLMEQEIFDRSTIRPIARAMKAIPIASTMGPREMIRSLRTASEAIR